MVSYSSPTEQAILESILPDLEAEGFDVFVQPSHHLLPRFMENYQPDAIALRSDRKIAIEVKSKFLASDKKIRQLHDIFAHQPEWELRVFYAPPRTAEQIIDRLVSKSDLTDSLNSLPMLLTEAGPVPAILTAWSAFEAAARLLMPKRLERPQPSAHLVDLLAFEGYLTPSEADRARPLGILRNRAAHGDFSIDFDAAQLEDIAVMTAMLLELSPNERLD